MAIIPINSINTSEIINNITKSFNTQETDESFIPFADMLEDAVANVYNTDAAVQVDALKIASGDTDALHTLTIDMAKADLAIQTLVQVRNKALDAYNEIMRITL
ncbi:MAG: flagellar hook-basal body complex protein FliE [Clostridiales bacterium GWF2_36_10]|nr:MAG: flagellar hook-basal body complex protein FliE [Clostridiales bacterium GWF2_36_10]HAN20862.1 flagellar hook-basal body complex protein FliE [Clostridiales bacterium]